MIFELRQRKDYDWHKIFVWYPKLIYFGSYLFNQEPKFVFWETLERRLVPYKTINGATWEYREIKE